MGSLMNCPTKGSCQIPFMLSLVLVYQVVSKKFPPSVMVFPFSV